jgi:hypothetical protein
VDHIQQRRYPLHLVDHDRKRLIPSTAGFDFLGQALGPGGVETKAFRQQEIHPECVRECFLQPQRLARPPRSKQKK